MFLMKTIYLYMYYIYIHTVVGLWLNPLAAPSLNSKIRSALFGSLGTQKSWVSSKEQVAIAVASKALPSLKPLA